MMLPESQLIFNNEKEENLKFDAYNFNEKCSGNLLFDENGKITKFLRKINLFIINVQKNYKDFSRM